MMRIEDLERLLRIYRDGLLEDTLPFWFPRSVDREYDGFLTCVGRDGTLLDSDKGMWQQARCSWLLGELYNNVEPREEWLQWCRCGIRFIERHGFDPADGRLWFQLSREGAPIRKRRYAFSEAFAAIAFGEFAKATAEDRYAFKARNCFHRFLEHSREGAEPPKFTETRTLKNLAFPMIALVTAQQLRESIDLEEARTWIDRSIDEIRRDFVKVERRAVMENVGSKGEIIDHFDGRILNPGHAIECSWFIMEEGRLRADQDLVELGSTMLDWMWERGWDREYGGVLYFVDLEGLPVQEYWHDMKFWWPQNETVIATLLAYELTGEKRYARMHRQIHDWAYALFPDPEQGEWFGYFHRDGRLSVSLKGNLWKGPFHLPRMQLNCWRIVERLARPTPSPPPTS